MVTGLVGKLLAVCAAAGTSKDVNKEASKVALASKGCLKVVMCLSVGVAKEKEAS
jgi:hypothetical protein